MSEPVACAPFEGHALWHLRGPGARAAIEAAVADAPTAALTAWTLPEGGFVACLGRKEYFLLTPVARPLLTPVRADDLTVTARSDAVFHVSGEQAGLWLQQTSPVNLAARPEQDFLMSRLLKIGCWLTWAGVAHGDQGGFLIGCDPTFGDYLGKAINQSLQDFAAALASA